ncbi:MAG: hypothetical protein ACRDL6_08300 [Solirubrobacterales bacterium]
MNGLRPELRLTLLGFATLALIAGALLVIGANDTEDWFSWTIEPPLSAAALGTFYWGALVLFVSGARARGWLEVRPIAYPVLLIAVILLVVTLVHLDKFDMDSLFGIFWLCAYIVAPPLLLYGIVKQRAAGPGPLGPPLPPPLRLLLALEGALLLAAGALMLLAPDSAADLWPWALTPLTSRALGTFILSVSLVALTVVRDNRFPVWGLPTALIVLGVLELLAVVLHSDDLGGDDLATALYLGFLAAVVATGTYGAIAERASSRS